MKKSKAQVSSCTYCGLKTATTGGNCKYDATQIGSLTTCSPQKTYGTHNATLWQVQRFKQNKTKFKISLEILAKKGGDLAAFL